MPKYSKSTRIAESRGIVQIEGLYDVTPSLLWVVGDAYAVRPKDLSESMKGLDARTGVYHMSEAAMTISDVLRDKAVVEQQLYPKTGI